MFVELIRFADPLYVQRKGKQLWADVDATASG